MKHENKVTNTSLAPPANEIVEGRKAQKTWMNMLDSRYQNYSKPFMVMTLVAVIKFVLMIITFLIAISAKPKMTKTCTTTLSYEQFYGSAEQIRGFMKYTRRTDLAASSEEVEMDVHVDMCLLNPVKVTSYMGAPTSFGDEGTDKKMNYLRSC